jgi:inorganic pyrophosphatase
MELHFHPETAWKRLVGYLKSDSHLLQDSDPSDICVPVPSPYEGTCYRTSPPLGLIIRIRTSTIDDKSVCNGFVASTNTKNVKLRHNICSNGGHMFLC